MPVGSGGATLNEKTVPPSDEGVLSAMVTSASYSVSVRS
jgi:hypothetical protein